MTIATERPKLEADRVYAVFRNAKTGKSKTRTIYGCDENQAAEIFDRGIEAVQKSSRKSTAVKAGERRAESVREV